MAVTRLGQDYDILSLVGKSLWHALLILFLNLYKLAKVGLVTTPGARKKG